MEKKRYIRIGDIPNDEKSRIWRGGEPIGEEIGVSCYDAYFANGRWNIVFPSPLSEDAINTLFGLMATIGLTYKVSDPRKAYLVDGDVVGYGSDNEPLLRNVKVIEDVTKDLTMKKQEIK